jgi:hypothetical protein
MEWPAFFEAHFRPHLVAANLDRAAEGDAARVLVDDLAAIVAFTGTYAVSLEADRIRFAFEKDDDAGHLADMLAAERLSGDAEWSTRATVEIDGALRRRIAAHAARARSRNR